MKYDHSVVNVMRLKKMAQRMRLDALDMALSTGNYGSHLGGSFSCMEILAVLYGEVLRVDPAYPLSEERDIFLPSKNHCVLAHIPALAERGFIEHGEILEFQKNGGQLTGYPMRPELGLEYSGGSLGMAISVGIGIALHAKEIGSDKRIYVLMGDGELAEGSVWEAFLAAAQFELSNLTVIIDRNHLSYDGDTEKIMKLNSIGEKLTSFHWHVSLCDGHSEEALLNAFEDTDSEKPQIIIAETIKGKGVSFIENRPEWHHHSLSRDQYEQAVQEVREAKL